MADSPRKPEADSAWRKTNGSTKDAHPMKAAKAAANYLSLLYNQFGSWSLALAAYNAGENAVQGALDKSGLKTFWDLREHGYLPAETRDYVPKVFAAVKIIRNPERYGFHMGSKHFVARQDTVSVPGGLQFSWVGKQIGVPEDILRSKQSRALPVCHATPDTRDMSSACLPEQGMSFLADACQKNPGTRKKLRAKPPRRGESPALSSYKVKSGDTLSGIGQEAELFRYRSGCAKRHEAFRASQVGAGFEASL